MSTTLKKSIAGIAVLGFLALGFVTPAKAATIEELQALIADLTAQLAALSGGSSATSCTTYGVSAVVRQGMNGANVVAVQRAVNHTGAATLATDGAFGPATKAGVMAAQVKLGATADGVWGPNTQAKYQAWVTNTCDDEGVSTPGNGTLSGDIGSIADTSPTVISKYNDEEVGEGEDDVPVAGWELEADIGSDLRLISARLKFNGTAVSGSQVLTKYVDEVSVWFDGEKIAEIDADEFSKSSTGVYSSSVSLDSSAIIDADEKADFVIAVSAQNTIDSNDLNGDASGWTVDLETLRYEDASGVILTDALTITPVEMDFVSFSTAADTELKISKSSDSPEDGIVIVDDASGEDDVVLLSGKLRLDGDSDVNLDELPVTFTTGGQLLSRLADSLILVLDGEEYSESSTTTSGTTSATITFNDLDFDISGGDSIDFEVRADIAGTDDYGEGATLLASITSDNRSAIDATDDEGDQVADSDKTGTAIGEAQEFRSEGIKVTLDGTPSATTNADATFGTFTIRFTVEAIGDDAYIGTSATKYTYALQEASAGATTGGVSAAVTNYGGNGNSISTTSGGNWKINEGTSIDVELQVFRSDLAAGAYRAVMTALGWDNSDADAALDNSYTSNMDDFKTSYVQLI